MRAAARWTPPAVWMGFIFYLSSLPHLPQIAKGPLGEALSYSAHFLEYGVLTMLIYKALLSESIQHKGLAALLISVAYAVLDEVHQMYVPHRSGSLWDIAADSFGSLVFLGIALTVYKSRGS